MMERRWRKRPRWKTIFVHLGGMKIPDNQFVYGEKWAQFAEYLEEVPYSGDEIPVKHVPVPVKIDTETVEVNVVPQEPVLQVIQEIERIPEAEAIVEINEPDRTEKKMRRLGGVRRKPVKGEDE